MEEVLEQEKGAAPTNVVGGAAGWMLDQARAWLLRIRQEHGRQKRIALLETLAVGGKKQILLIECAGEQFLVGTGADSIQTITRIGRGPSIDADVVRETQDGGEV